MSKLKDFLVDLMSDGALLKRYQGDAQGEMTRAGLTSEESIALQSGDGDRIRAAMGLPPAQHMTQNPIVALLLRADDEVRAVNATLEEIQEAVELQEAKRIQEQMNALASLKASARQVKAARNSREAARKRTKTRLLQSVLKRTRSAPRAKSKGKTRKKKGVK